MPIIVHATTIDREGNMAAHPVAHRGGNMATHVAHKEDSKDILAPVTPTTTTITAVNRV